MPKPASYKPNDLLDPKMFWAMSGQNSHVLGLARNKNPIVNENTPEYTWWNQGWDIAEQSERETVDLKAYLAAKTAFGGDSDAHAVAWFIQGYKVAFDPDNGETPPCYDIEARLAWRLGKASGTSENGG